MTGVVAAKVQAPGFRHCLCLPELSRSRTDVPVDRGPELRPGRMGDLHPLALSGSAWCCVSGCAPPSLVLWG